MKHLSKCLKSKNRTTLLIYLSNSLMRQCHKIFDNFVIKRTHLESWLTIKTRLANCYVFAKLFTHVKYKVFVSGPLTWPFFCPWCRYFRMQICIIISYILAIIPKRVESVAVSYNGCISIAKSHTSSSDPTHTHMRTHPHTHTHTHPHTIRSQSSHVAESE